MASGYNELKLIICIVVLSILVVTPRALFGLAMHTIKKAAWKVQDFIMKMENYF
jgi:hypothetical protein